MAKLLLNGASVQEIISCEFPHKFELLQYNEYLIKNRGSFDIKPQQGCASFIVKLNPNDIKLNSHDHTYQILIPDNALLTLKIIGVVANSDETITVDSDVVGSQNQA